MKKKKQLKNVTRIKMSNKQLRNKIILMEKERKNRYHSIKSTCVFTPVERFLFMNQK